MGNEQDILCSILRFLPQITESVTVISKRSGISPQAALLLSVVESFPEFALSQRMYLSQLENEGFVKLEGNDITVTGKGAILAKAVKDAKEKFYNSRLTAEEKAVLCEIFNKL